VNPLAFTFMSTRKVSGSINRRNLSDREFNNLIRRTLRAYIENVMDAKGLAVENYDKGTIETFDLVKDIEDPNFASVVVAYMTLVSQEQQADLNLRLQWLIALVAVGTLVTGFLSVVLLYVPH
jgi:hypothetical protein